MIDRILQNTVANITATFDVDGVNTAVTGGLVTITRVSDGSTVVSAGSAVGTGNTGQVMYTLSTVQTALLDRLKATWTGTVGSQAQTVVTYVDVVGGFLISLADLKALYPSKTADEWAFIRAVAEDRLEGACGMAFVPRFRLDTVGRPRWRGGWGAVRLPFDDVRAIRSVTQRYHGVTYTWTVAQLAVADIRGPLLRGPFSSGWGEVTVGYEHGLDAPGNEAMQVALLVAQEEFPTSGTARDARIIRQESDNQAVLYAAPSADRPFVNTRINQFVAATNPPLVA